MCQPKKRPVRRKQNERGTIFIIDRLKNNDQMDFQIKKKLFFYLEKGGKAGSPLTKQCGLKKNLSFHHRCRAPRDPVAHRSHRTIAALVARCLVPSLWPSGQPCDASPSEAGFTGPPTCFC